MRLKEALVFLLITVSGVFAKDPTPAPDAPPAPATPPVTCQTRDPSTEPKPADPMIADTFEMTVEVTNVKSPETWIIKEYYDKPNNRTAKYTTKGTEETRELYDYTNKWSFTAKMKDKECTEDKKPDTKIPNMFKFVDGGLQDFFDHTATHNFTYINKTQIRGIPCVQWSTCMQKTTDGVTKDVIIDWYFAEASANMPYDHGKTVPVRLDVIEYNKDKALQDGDLTNHLMYDFISYSKKITDSSVFWPELRFLCGKQDYYTDRNKQVNKTQPNIANSFSVDIEQIHMAEDVTTVTSGKYAMDKENKLMRMDIEIGKSDNSNYKEKCSGTGKCKIIHDYTSGAEYVFDTKGKCKIFAIKPTADNKLPIDAMWDGDHKDDNNKTAYLLLATGMQLFSIDNTTAFYQGERKFRDVTTDAWAFNNKADAYREFLFQKPTESQGTGKLFGYLENGKSGETQYQLRTNFYNYNAETPDQSAFDVHGCFVNDTDFKTLHARVDLKENWEKVNETGLATLQPLIRKKLANLAGIAVLRITDMQIATDNKKNDGKVQVWFTILSPTPTGGAMYASDGSVKPDKKLKDAEDSLEDKLDKNDVPVQRNVTDKDGKMKQITLVTIIKDSLKADDDALKGDPRSSQQSNKSSGHSSAQMGVLAFFMLVLGAILGVGIGWWMWKRRNRGVPYQIHH